MLHQGPWGHRLTQKVHTQGKGHCRPRGLWELVGRGAVSLGARGRPPGEDITSFMVTLRSTTRNSP